MVADGMTILNFRRFCCTLHSCLFGQSGHPPVEALLGLDDLVSEATARKTRVA